jgi:hypothetical protein
MPLAVSPSWIGAAVAVAGGIRDANPLQATAGAPTPCILDAPLGASRQAIRLSDFPQLAGTAAIAAAANPAVFQPIVDALAQIWAMTVPMLELPSKQSLQLRSLPLAATSEQR